MTEMQLRRSLDRGITGLFRETNDKETLLEWIETLGGPAFCRAFRFDTPRGGQVVVGSTLLHHAVAMKSNLHLRVLLDVGVSVDALDAQGCTPLHYLCGFIERQPRLPGGGAELMAAIDTKLDMLVEAGASLDVEGNGSDCRGAVGPVSVSVLRTPGEEVNRARC